MLSWEVILGLEIVTGLFPQSTELLGRLGRWAVRFYHECTIFCDALAFAQVSPYTPHNSPRWGSLKLVARYEWITCLLCSLYNNPASLWVPASRDMQSSPYQPTRASSAGSPTVTHCTPSSGTTGRKRRSFSISSTASCYGYVMRLPNPVL